MAAVGMVAATGVVVTEAAATVAADRRWRMVRPTAR